MVTPQPLTAEEQATYEWQIWVPDFGEAGQEKLKGATVAISRCGGLGSVVAYELAAAGVGKLILAHAGNVKPSDLNRQLLMTHDWLGKPRIESVERRLKELNPRLKIEAHAENISDENVDRIMENADLIIDCAPLFNERFAMNRIAIERKIPLVECAMYDLEAQLTTILPGKTPCLRCLFPGDPPEWRREFPVFGAVSGSVGCMAALEAIKVLAGFGEPLYDQMLMYDLRDMTFHKRKIQRRTDCECCASLFA
ncbi:MAG: HesA/MoeB/ThiF family protein [Planctomycetaceae bacterium]|nr:HesA/MoeB/ThiF family protein [Planctomycetaceae bacterium]